MHKGLVNLAQSSQVLLSLTIFRVLIVWLNSTTQYTAGATSIAVLHGRTGVCA